MRRRTRSAARFDCFYVYPTVSTESGTNADLTVQPAETAAAFAQASRFSQVCNVWAPMYRQATSGALAKGEATNPAVIATAYDSLLAAWKDYLAHDNHGRPIVFIGHSQGAAMLIKLLADPGRPVAPPAQAHGLGHHPGRERPGADGQDRRRQLQEHPDVRLGLADRLRHRLLELRLDAPGRLPSSPARAKG